MRNSRSCWSAFIVLAISLLAIGFRSSTGLGNEASIYPQGCGDSLIVPGERIGAVGLSDAESKIFELFPKPSIGSYTQPGPSGLACGTEYTVGLLEDAKRPGFLHIYTKGGRITEIEADGARYHTARGVSSSSSPTEVRLHYPGLESYLFLGGYYEALNEGPLVLWTDKKRGIGFTFAYPSLGDKRLIVFTVIVFRPNANFCVQGSSFPNSNNWRKLAPYSLGASDAVAQTGR